ncbi:MAG: M1 family metallopeptidase, partial [Bacteroidetes bacterium]|nr:M1 family metallopeptidase [Bacteroidota bacterium]
DILRKGGVRDNPVPPDYVNDGVEIQKLVIDGTEYTSQENEEGSRFWGGPSKGTYRRSGTNMTVRLNEQLMTGKSVSLEVEWTYTFEQRYVRRMGSYGNENWFIAYWYPQMAVYDDIDGWDRNYYNGTQEMYNDFSDFEVSITVPDSFVVWATGELQNGADVLQPEIWADYQRAATTDEVIKLAREEDHKNARVVKSGDSHTWTFQASHVPDFAFAVSRNLNWDATSVEVAPGRRVLINIAYLHENRFYDQAAEIAQKCLLDMSTQVPGVPYPYPVATVFNGGRSGGGMEFPMMFNDGAVRNRSDLIDLTYHEIAHTYFPFYMGTNERKYGWMDEGWASILPNNLIRKEEPLSGDPMMSYSLSYSRFAGTEDDVPMMTPTKYLTGRPYSMHIYSKPASAYYVLWDMLGDETFKNALQAYMEAWNGKHPLPYDFFFTFNKATGKNLNWFWKSWFFERGVPDLGIKEVEAKGKSVKITVEKVGNYPVPIHLTLSMEDGSKEEIHHTAEVWADGKKEFFIKAKYDQPVTSIVLGRVDFPDSNRQNDVWSASNP